MSSLYAKLAKAVSLIEDPSKTSTNPHFGNKYAGLEETVDVVKAGLDKAGLSMVTLFDGRTMVLRVFDSETGEFVDSRLEMPFDALSGNISQQIGAMTTYYRRYTLQAFFSLVAEDDDGESGPVRATAQRKVEHQTTSNVTGGAL